MSFLIDTNVLSELVRPRPCPAVRAWFAGLDRCTISVITVEEVRFGLTLKPNPRLNDWFDRFFRSHCDILAVSMDVAQWCGRMRAQLRGEGRTRTQADMLIAGTAALHNLTLATRNERDFSNCGISLFNPF